MTIVDPTNNDIDPSGFTLCMFPKHRGIPWEDVVEEDPKYVHWLISGEGPEMDEELYDFLEELLEAQQDYS